MITNPQAEIYGVRPARPEDFVPAPAHVTRVGQVRDLHHQIARAIVAGHKNIEISEKFGVSPSRVTQLKSDPAFKGLLEEYRSEDRQRYDAAQDRLASIFYLSMEILQERLLDDPEQVSTPELLRVLEAVADRSGHSPVRRSQIEGHIVTRSEKIEQIKREAKLEMVQRRDNVGRIFQGRATSTEEEPSSGANGRAALSDASGEGDSSNVSDGLMRALDTMARDFGKD
jgi:hypothetical protein